MNQLQAGKQKLIHLTVTLLCTFLLCTLVFNVLGLRAVHAATNTVVGAGTAASCTEAALESALAAGGTVTFDCGAAAHTITLTSVKTLNVDVTIDGGDLITLSGGNHQGIFTVPTARAVTLRALKIIDAPGKAIYNSGTVTLFGVTFSDNPGGAIYSAGGTVIVFDSTFERNSAAAGGAITNENGGSLSIVGSTFRNNSTIGSGSGGAVYGSVGSTNSIVNSLFEGNAALSGSAGAIYNSNVMTIEHTIVRNNTAAGGGGIQNNGNLTIIDSHISGNEATSIGGGGIVHFNQTQSPSHLSVFQSTIDHNTAAQGGGGILFSGEQAIMVVVNTTIYTNTAATNGGGVLIASGNSRLTNVTISDNDAMATAGDNIENSDTAIVPGTIRLENTLVVGGGCVGTVIDGDGNLEFPGITCGFDTPSADPGLGALMTNGGWTPTLAIKESGPAQNAAIDVNCPATDQRGVLRPQFATCDIGAFEWGARPVLDSIAPTSTLALSPTFTLVVNGSNFIPGTPQSRVVWDGEALSTTYISPTELRATVDASRIVAGGLVSVTVETLAIDGGVSAHTEIFTIFKRDQRIDFAELAERGVEPATFTIDATATSKLAVTFTAAGVCTVMGNTVTLTGETGTCTITAQQAGNVSYNPAPDVVRSFAVSDDAYMYIPHIFGRTVAASEQ